MSRDSDEFPGGSQNPSRPRPPGAQGASRGGARPDDSDGNFDANDAYRRPNDEDRVGTPLGGNPFGSRQSSGGWRSFFSGGPRFLGMPVNMIYTLGAALIGLVFIGAVCGRPVATGSVAGQVKGLNADKTLTTLAGAQLVLRGSGQTYTATSTDVPADAEGEAAYNYRFETVPAGEYVMSVTPPAGSTYQSEDSIRFKVEGGQLFPQSVMLLGQGIQKPRQLAQSELRDGEAGGYVNDRGERVVYQQGGGFDASDALLMYLLWRNPPGFGYYSPPIIYSPSGSSTSNYRVADPPSSTRSGQTVTQQKPSTAGQGATRPSGSTGVTGAGPSTSSGSSSSSRPSDAVAPAQSNPSSGSSSSGSNTSTQTQTRPAVSAPSQGASRPSSSTSSRPSSSSSSSSRSSGSSGGGRR
jgi:hypothetical protein